MKRRDFIAGLGATAAWPAHASAQLATVPIVGCLSGGTSEGFADLMAAFRQGLGEAGFVAGKNIAIEYRWAEGGHYDRLPALASDLVSRNAAVIFANPIPAALAAKQATSAIPIVFAIGSDPVESGLVASMNRPGGNITGVSFLSVALSAKRLELVRDLVPKAATIAVLINPQNPNADFQTHEIKAAAASFGLQLNIRNVGSRTEFESVFAELVQRGTDALLVSADPFLISQRDQLVALAARHVVPAVYAVREFVQAGGLLSYGSSFAEGYRQAGIYTGRILKGERPADLPVIQPTKYELVINLKTAKSLGLTIPPTLLARADEVIE
jgi:putative tryptophan/tyrosine transport system substrate-binding protein